MLLRAVLVAAFFVSCMGNKYTPDPTGQYPKKEMRIKVDGIEAVGTYVVERRDKFTIDMFFPKASTVFKAYTCNRAYTFDSPMGGHHRWVFRPQELEATKNCQLELAAFNKDFKNSYALIDFVTNETLPAELVCNGETYKTLPVSICQSRVGLIQRIRFKSYAQVYFNDAKCPKPKLVNGNAYDIKLALGKCHYVFRIGKNIHRLTTVAYDDQTLKDKR